MQALLKELSELDLLAQTIATRLRRMEAGYERHTLDQLHPIPAIAKAIKLSMDAIEAQTASIQEMLKSAEDFEQELREAEQEGYDDE